MNNKLFKPITEERMAQLINDAAENIASGTVAEWRSVARMLLDDQQKLQNQFNALRDFLLIEELRHTKDVTKMVLDSYES